MNADIVHRTGIQAVALLGSYQYVRRQSEDYCCYVQCIAHEI